MSTNQSGISNNTIYKELNKNINLLMKVIEVEDESMRITFTKVIDVAKRKVAMIVTIVPTNISLAWTALKKLLVRSFFMLISSLCLLFLFFSPPNDSP